MTQAANLASYGPLGVSPQRVIIELFNYILKGGFMSDRKLFLQALSGGNRAFLAADITSGAASRLFVLHAKKREENQQEIEKTIRRIFK